MFIIIFFQKKELEGLLLGANVKIAFFIHLHMVKMRDDKNAMKITNNKKISVLLKIVRII